MFGTIRRHQTWLWIVIAGITIVSFVVYFGPNNNKLLDSLGGGRQANYGTIGGKAITREQFENAKREAYLQYYFRHHQWPDRSSTSDFNEARDTYLQLFLNHMQDQLGIEISPQAVADRARRMLGGASPDELLKILSPEHLDLDDFERFVRRSMGMEQLYMTAGLNGLLVTPQEAETLYRNEHQDVVSSAVFFSASNHLASVIVTPALISQFYTNELANYRIPKRVQVDYLKYNITNHLADAKKTLTNLDQIIDNTSQLRLMATNAESRTKVKDDIIRDHALRETIQEANAFAVALDEMPAGTNRVANFASLASKSNVTVRTLAPFDMRTGPHEMDVSADFVRAAFKLTLDEPFSAPIPAEDGVYLLALKHTLPTEIPPLTNIEAQVTKDYRLAKATQMAQEASIKFHATATNGLAQGKTFAVIASQAGLRPESVPPFSVSSTNVPGVLENHVSLRMLKEAVFSTPVGKVSPPLPSREGAVVLYVEKRLPIDEAKMKKELPSFTAYVRDGRLGDAFNQWLQRQVARDPGFATSSQKAIEESQPKSSGSRPPNS